MNSRPARSSIRSSSTLIIASPPRGDQQALKKLAALFERELLVELVQLFQAKRLYYHVFASGEDGRVDAWRSQRSSPPLATHSGLVSWRMTTPLSLGRSKASKEEYTPPISGS
jgi:hypothetical protein